MIPGILASTGRFLDIAALPNCALWLDASDASTITQSSGSVSQINDKSGNGRHFTQGTSTNQPRINTHTQNGLAVLDFDGTNDSMSVTNSNIAANIGGLSLYVVAKPHASAASQTLFSISTNGSNPRAQININQTSDRASLEGRRLDADSTQRITGTSSIGTSFRAYAGIIDFANSNAELYVGSTLDASSSSFQTDGNTSSTNSQLLMSWGWGTSSRFYGNLAEIIVFQAVHTADQRALIWAYLNRKWGLS